MVPTGSLVDLTVELERATTVEEANEFSVCGAQYRVLHRDPRQQRRADRLPDIVKSPYSAIFDAPLTTVVDET